MANELDNEREQSGFFDNIKKNIVGYTVVAAVAVGATLLLTKGDEPVQEPYPANDEPKDILSIEEIGGLYYQYDVRAKHIETRQRQVIPDFKAARAILFDYQDLKNYVAFIEKNSLEANIRISGLRFYFGKYKNDKTGKDSGRQMLFFNPTIDTLIDKERVNLAYALKRDGDNVSIAFLKDIVKKPDTTVGRVNSHDNKGTGKKSYIINEASVLSFLNFSTDHHFESQGKNGGQQSPPPSSELH